MGNVLIGTVIGWLFTTAVLRFDLNGIASLAMESGHQGLALFILHFFFGITFGFGYLTTAILMLPTNMDDFDRV